MKRIIFVTLALAISLPVAWGESFVRSEGDTSVVLGPICTYSTSGQERVDIDFNTTSLTITAYASGDGVDSSFTYTGGNIDDYDGTPPAWGNPTTSAIEVEDDDECIRLHVRDEVFAVAGATEWTILIDDGTTTIMDSEVRVVSVLDGVVEDQGSTYTAREVLSLLLSEAMGTCTYSSGARTWVCSDPSGAEQRFTITYSASLDGTRTSSTPSPP